MELIQGKIFPDTFDVDDFGSVELQSTVTRLYLYGKRLHASVLTANQLGCADRIVYLHMSEGMRVRRVLCNYDAIPPDDEKPLYSKPTKIFNIKSEKLLVPVYSTLNITGYYETGKIFELESKDTRDNRVFMCAQILLNNDCDWVARDYDTIRNPDTKIGRNMPCPCGSGMKYKKCCGNQKGD